jgi:hypothetical protein
MDPVQVSYAESQFHYECDNINVLFHRKIDSNSFDCTIIATTITCSL